MADIQLDLYVKADQRRIDRAADDIQRRFRQAGDDAANDFAREFATGLRNVDARTAANTMARDFSAAGTRAGQQFADSASTSMRRGDWNGAGREAARDFQRSFERQANPRVDIDARSSAADAGGEAGDSFSGGFAGAIAGLGARGGPIAAAIAGGVLAGVKLVGPQVQAAMAQEFSIDMTQARLGLDDATMRNVADGAAQAFAQNWGASLDANLSTATSAIQSGLIAPTADAGAMADTIAQLETVSTLLGEDVPAVARSAAQAIRTGIAADATQAFDLLIKGQQRGLNVSQDLLDTVDEYSTQFRAMGLTGTEAFGLLTQAVQGGARDTDKAADFIKEGIIRMTDGSTTTTEAFESLGLNAQEMASRFAGGGRTAATAFDEVLDKIRAIPDPVEQSRTAVALFGTQAEDMQGAIRNLDLSTAVQQFGQVEGASQRAADTMVNNSLDEWQQAGRNIQTVINGIRDSLNMDQWFSSIPRAVNDWLGPDVQPTPSAPGVPAVVAPAPGPAVTQPALPTAPTQQNPLDVFAPTNRDGIGGPTAADFYGPNASGVDQGILQIAEIARQFGLTMTSGLRPGETSSWHSVGAAGDFSGAPEDMEAFAEYLATNFGSQLKELIYTPGGARTNLWNGKPHTYSASTAADHYDHAHVALADNTPLRNGAVPVHVVSTDTASGAYPSDETRSSSTSHGGSPPSMGQIGVPIDADFGLSNGLAGLADNATRQLGNLGFAPLMGALDAIRQSSPIQGGYGLMGIMGAQNIANGLSPLGMSPLTSPTLGAQPFGPQDQGPQGPFGPPPGPTAPVGHIPGSGGWQPNGGGGPGIGGGALGAAASAGSMALDVMAPGAGQAAQTAMKLIERTIQFGGQVASIGVQGIMETFLPSGSPLGDPQASWLGRLAAGLAGARPAVPTSAGQTQAPVQPQQHQGTGAPPGPQGPTVNIESFVQAPNRNGMQTAQDLAFRQYAAQGGR